ncbi:MAG: helix-turn-helix transcriptional regulator [Acetobacteraceae bacterium]
MDAKRISSLIGDFYTASVEPERWAGVAAQVARFFGSESTAIQVRSRDLDRIVLRATTPNYDEAAQRTYAQHFRKLDVWVNGWQGIGAAGIFVGRQLVDPHDLKRSEFHNDFCRRVGIFHFLGAGVPLDAGTSLMLGIHRPIGRDDFTAEHKRHLELVLPHLSRAMQVRMLLAAADVQRRLACEMFEALSLATIVVDAGCRIVFANHPADRLLAKGDGLTPRQGRLTMRDPRHDAELQRAVSNACSVTGPPAGVLLVRRPGKRPLSLLVSPFRASEALSETGAAIFVSDPEIQRPPATSVLAALYGLTPAEARLLASQLQGERIADYAERVGISINTANTQLKQIFAKTETNRQSELMRQMLSNPVASLWTRE